MKLDIFRQFLLGEVSEPPEKEEVTSATKSAEAADRAKQSASQVQEIEQSSNSPVSPDESGRFIRFLQWCFQWTVLVNFEFTLRFSLFNLAITSLVLSLVAPAMTYPLFALFRLVLGTLYPAYASYKAVRTKNVREYVKWMMYWIVFAFFTSIESFADVFVAFWFPFYYEMKILVLLWLLSPVSRGSLGSSLIYRKFVHPQLCKREEEIDRMLERAQEQGYNTILDMARKAVNYFGNVVMQTAMRGGGGLMHQIRKSYSLTDLGTIDDQDYGRVGREGSTNRRALEHNPSEDEYEDVLMRERSESRGRNDCLNFPETDVNVGGRSPRNKDAYPSTAPSHEVMQRSQSEKASTSSSLQPEVRASRRTVRPRAATESRPKSMVFSSNDDLVEQDMQRVQSMAAIPQKTKPATRATRARKQSKSDLQLNKKKPTRKTVTLKKKVDEDEDFEIPDERQFSFSFSSSESEFDL